MTGPCAKLRKRTEAVTPVIATILMVAITVVLAAVLWAFIGGMTVKPPEGYISAKVDSNQTNWSAEIISIQLGQLALNDVQLVVKKADLTVGLGATLLSTMVSGAYTHGVRYIDATDPAYLNAGDTITLDRSIYASGSEIVLTPVDGQEILASIPIR